jgi:hypothetical protein
MSDRILRDTLLASLRARYANHGVRESTARQAVAIVPARHPEVGDLSIAVTATIASNEGMGVQVSIGTRLGDTFRNYDTHLDRAERATRVTADVVRFLDALFADQLLLWVAVEGPGSGWREHGDTSQMEPLVTDNRVYHRFVWSGPLSPWQAVPAILERGAIRNEREHDILERYAREHADGPEAPERARARALVDAYERAARGDAAG